MTEQLSTHDLAPQSLQVHNNNQPYTIGPVQTQLQSIDTIPSQQHAFQNPKTHSNPHTLPYKIFKIFLIFSIQAFLTVLLYQLSFNLQDPTTLQSFSIKNVNITAIFVVTTKNQTLILQAVKSLQKGSQGRNFGKVIIGCGRNVSVETLSQLDHVQWVFTRKAISMEFLDQLVGMVESQYFFLSTTNWHLQSGNVVLESLHQLRTDPQIAQVITDPSFPPPSPSAPAILQPRATGYSLNPSIHRTSDYRQLLPSGYSFIAGKECQLTKNCERVIAEYYFTRGKYVVVTNRFWFVEDSEEEGHSGKNQGGLAYVQGEEVKKAEGQTASRTDSSNSEQGKKESSINSRLALIQKRLRQGPKILNQKQILIQKQLPFCLLLTPTLTPTTISIDTLRKSITRQIHKNYKLIDITTNKNKLSYYQLKALIKEKCQKNSIVMFVNLPLVPGALKYLNQQYQKYKIYLTYTKTQTTYQILSFLSRIYDLLQTNDFSKKNAPYLTQNNKQVQLLALFELGATHTKLVQKNKVVNSYASTYFSILKDNPINYNYEPYQKLLRLSQDMEINVDFMESWVGSLAAKRSPRSNLTKKSMEEAIQRQDLWYLPQGHTIQQLEYMEYDKKFNISQYATKDRQVSFCVTVISHNNIQNNRYIKVIESITQQKYDNYHIIFIDDNSTDTTLQSTKSYLKTIKFPKFRIKFIKNLHRNYATYNLINAAFNFCQQDNIQLLVDGDDELIGKYTLQVMNAVYQRDPELWVVYSNYKTSNFEFGRSVPFQSEYEHVGLDGKRLYVSGIGPIRTWRVQLLYNIPLSHHKMQNGNWLDTVYDDALQHPLLQLSSIRRVHYLNQILYQYNVKYGDNDDSTYDKVVHRNVVYKYILGLTPLKKIQKLEGSKKNEGVVGELEKGRGVRYRVEE